MDTETAVGALGLSGLVAATGALVKGLYPGDLPKRAVPGVVLVATVGLMALAYVSGAIDGTPYELAARAIMQTAAAMGLREGVVTAVPGASTLPTR